MTNKKQKIFFPISVEYLGDWNLLITFENGEKKVYACDDIQDGEGETINPLKDIEFFKKAYINDADSLAWNDDLEVCPDGLYNESIPYGEWLEQQTNSWEIKNISCFKDDRICIVIVNAGNRDDIYKKIWGDKYG